MAAKQVHFSQLSFTFDGMNDILFDRIDLTIGAGWTGVVGANGTGKTTLLKLATGIIRPNVGAVTSPEASLYADQRTDDPSPMERTFAHADDGEAWRIKGLLAIEYDWIDRWELLSQGERKRLQIGACLWANPALLAVDEPTNHLDGPTRELVKEGLQSYTGVGLLVSHDRDLLDSLTVRTLILGGGGVELRSGSFSHAWKERKREIQNMRDRYMNEKRALVRLKRDENRRRQLAEQQHARRSKKGLAIKDHDGRYRKNIARISGKDGVGGRLLRQMDGRLRQAESRMDSYRTERDRKMGIHVETTRSKSDALFVGRVNSLPLGPQRVLSLPELIVEPGSRIGLTGPNGSGKSTLVRHIIDTYLQNAGPLIYIPQEIGGEESSELRRRLLDLSKEDLGVVLSIVSRLGTRPDQLLDSEALSPGETRKLMLALGLHSTLTFIVMDEPTNHMDIPSIECIEEALSETECALLLVSHDRRFLDALVSQYWRIERNTENDSSLLRIEYAK